MSRSSGRRQPAVFIIIGLLLGVHLMLIVSGAGTPEARAQVEPDITHQGVDCVITQKHAIIRAIVRPASEIRVVRVYFRSVLYPEFYFVEATRNGDVFEAVIPRPKPETKRIVYYIEAVTHSFATARTNNFEPDVRDDETACGDDGIPPYFTGEDPNIIVGITQAGVPAIPPGFDAIGLAGRNFPTVPVAIGAGAAAAGVGILTSRDKSGDDGTTSPPPGGTTTTSSATTSTTTSTISADSPIACFAVEPDPPRIQTGDTVRFDADCSRPSQSGAGEITSYQWDFGDGRGGKEGRFVQRKYEQAGTFTATLTVTNQAGLQATESRNVIVEQATETTTTTTTVPNEANLTLSLSRSPASVASGGTVTFIIRVRNNGPRDASGVTLDNDITGSIGSGGITLTVTGGFDSCTVFPTSVRCNWGSMPAGSTGTVEFTVQTGAAGTITDSSSVGLGSPPCCVPSDQSISAGVTQLTTETTGQIDTSLTSTLESTSGSGILRGQVNLNGARVDNTDSSTPYRHPLQGRAGENTIEANLTSSDTREGIWRFDFREAAHFVRGSIQVDSGQVVTLGSQEVVFHVTGAGGPRIRFRYLLER